MKVLFCIIAILIIILLILLLLVAIVSVLGWLIEMLDDYGFKRPKFLQKFLD